MHDENSFQRALTARPDDWDTRRVYADWLDERGRTEEAFAQRWMADHRKRPRPFPSAYSWIWYDPSHVTNPIDPESDLPPEVWRALPHPERDQGRKVFESRHQAEGALAKGLALSPEGVA